MRCDYYYSNNKKKCGRPKKYHNEVDRKKAKNKKEYYETFKDKSKSTICESCNKKISYYCKYKHSNSLRHKYNVLEDEKLKSQM